MNTQSNAVSDSPRDSQAIPPASLSQTRPLYWSIRREIWENHSIYVAPLAIAAVYLLGFAVSVIWLPHNMREVWMPHTMREMATLKAPDTLIGLAMPYSHAAMLIGLTAFLVGIFYSLDALHGERRDRSVLFWKSLPVSDLTTVLSKAAIPLLVLPLIAIAVTIFLQQIMRLLSMTVLVVSGGSAATLWTRLPLSEMELVTLYGALVLVLWHAPIYCWFLLVSGWARRAVFLWAVLPLLAIAAMENIAFHTSFLGSMLLGRLLGFSEAAFDLKDKNGVPIDAHFIPLTQLAPGRFFSNPSLWLGLVFAAACLVAAVRQRRYREPL
ncbi:MAG: ABC transporter permease [Terriglobales bacterium]|jgi:ABC-2 type transport system permease protein